MRDQWKRYLERREPFAALARPRTPRGRPLIFFCRLPEVTCLDSTEVDALGKNW